MMIYGGAMRKKGWILLILCVLVCLCPVTVCANSAPPDPNDIYIAVDDFSKIEDVALWASVDGDSFEYIGDGGRPRETRRAHEKVIKFNNEGGRYTVFRLRISFSDGSSLESNAVPFEQWTTYLYDVEHNLLEQGGITSWKIDSITLFFILIGLILPLAVTLAVEWSISLAFGLRPDKYVWIANLITNPIMNILIVVLFNCFLLDYYLLLLFLEIAVATLEFWFYTIKYRQYSRKRILLFAVTANLASWGVYYLISNWWFA